MSEPPQPAGAEEPASAREGLEDFVPPVPDAVDLVVETATMMSVFAAQRLVRVDAMRREMLADAAGRGTGVRDVVERSIRLELAAAMRITEYAAGRMIAQAEALVNRYPGVLDALSCGRVTEKHAEIYVDLVDAVDPELRGRVVDAGLTLAEAEPVGSFRRALSDLIARVEAATLEQRFEAAVTQRRVWVDRGPDGMGLLGLHHPAVEVHAIHSRITAMAKAIAAAEGETRTLDQIRADLVADLLIDGTTSHVPAAASGIRAQVVVTVPALALLDDDAELDADTAAAIDADADAATDADARAKTDAVPDTGATTTMGAEAATDAGATTPIGDPPVVEGVGPIPLSMARRLCGGDARWMRVLTHPESGIVLSVGRDRYKPPAALRRLVRWRADRCMGPGCGMPASRCEIDHQIRWVDRGETSLENTAPFCKGHHLVKDNTDWVVRQVPGSGGAIRWISPTGRSYVVQPERRVPAFTTTGRDPGDPAPF
ncbi:HNH endonuclease signature motif containing protein [Microbacterium cremeum]|uniref:HNH endonuclease signature motif containing protein n=1 Tax=Microbacterium cremeum TaxID=2782169 RepID=UPI001888CD1A|nr:HNH endonuclease signature motif containing protein [Microbacterium cremeum]